MRWGSAVFLLLVATTVSVTTAKKKKKKKNDEVAAKDRGWCYGGIDNEDSVCCASECGLCGGDGCRNAPGGKSQCCAKTIIKGGPVCKDSCSTGCRIPEGSVELPPAPCPPKSMAPTPPPSKAPRISSAPTTASMVVASPAATRAAREHKPLPTRIGECKLTQLGEVLRDVHEEYKDSPVALNRIRTALGHIPEAYELALSRGSEAIWGSRRVWAPADCGAPEDVLKVDGCNRMCDRTWASHMFPEVGTFPYAISKPVTVGKAATCDRFSDLPNSAAEAVKIPGYGCIKDFPIATFTGAGCNDDFTGVHVSPTLSKNRPIVESFDALNHEAGVVMPFKYKHHFYLPQLYMWSMLDPVTKKSTETKWEEKIEAVVWRGALTAGPPPGLAAIQRCASKAGDQQSKNFRGKQGGIFVPGLSWRCRDGRYKVGSMSKHDRETGKAQMQAQGAEACEKSLRVLRKQPSRLEMTQRWQDSSVEDGVDLKFKWGARHTWGKAESVFRYCGISPSEGMLGPLVTNVSMNISRQLDHKYVLAVEGVDKASSTQWIMMSGSVLVMPPPSQESWLLEGRFAPWVHYAPVRPDFKDLKDVIEWLKANDDEARKIAEASKTYMEREFGETDDEYRLGAAVLRVYIAYVHAAGTLPKTASNPGGKAARPTGRCWINASWQAEGAAAPYSAPPEHTTFLHENWRFSARFDGQTGKFAGTLAVTVPLGFKEGDSFYITVPLDEDDPNYDPNGVGGVPYDEGHPFRPPILVTVPKEKGWTDRTFRVPV